MASTIHYARNGKGFLLSCDYDFPGNDLSKLQVAEWAECMEACSVAIGCKALDEPKLVATSASSILRGSPTALNIYRIVLPLYNTQRWKCHQGNESGEGVTSIIAPAYDAPASCSPSLDGQCTTANAYGSGEDGASSAVTLDDREHEKGSSPLSHVGESCVLRIGEDGQAFQIIIVDLADVDKIKRDATGMSPSLDGQFQIIIFDLADVDKIKNASSPPTDTNRPRLFSKGSNEQTLEVLAAPAHDRLTMHAGGKGSESSAWGGCE
ncbi:hypothetical protein V8F06_009799 [Rhypophila decipiens]